MRNTSILFKDYCEAWDQSIDWLLAYFGEKDKYDKQIAFIKYQQWGEKRHNLVERMVKCLK